MKLKKPKFWDKKKPNFISNLLSPLAKIVELGIKFQSKSKNRFKDIKTICVGNIYLGGTGKTSIAIEIKKLLDSENIRSCFIKKDYSDQVDEQNLLKKYGKVFTNKSRILALQNAVSEKYQIAIFDDGLQDKSIFYDLSFVCFNKKNMIGNGRIIPAGPLRENLDYVKEYQNIFLNGNNEETDELKNILMKQDTNLNIFNSTYEPLNLKDIDLNDKYVVFSGIGNHNTFVDTLIKNNINIIQDIEFPDHYNYSKKDLEKIIKISEEKKASVLTTEKDYLRLNTNYQDKFIFIQTYLKIDKKNELKEKLKKVYEAI